MFIIDEPMPFIVDVVVLVCVAGGGGTAPGFPDLLKAT
jgi:hypothetical protein